jgi:hypothetical protein
LISTVVTDNGVPPLSATNSFTVVVTEVNTAPVLPTQSDRTVTELSTLTVTNAATDADLPANILTYSLLAPPAGATINSNGVIVWTPALGQGPSTNTLTTVVTDNGSPALSATNSFIVVVQVFVPQFRITSIQVSNHLATVTWNSIAGKTYRLQYQDTVNATAWQDVVPDIIATGGSTSATTTVGGAAQRYFRLEVLP